MATKTVPVIRKDIVTGEETRYASIKEAAESIGVKPAQISGAILTDYKCHGAYWRREDDWQMK